MGALSALTILAGLADAIPLGQNAPLSKSLGLPVTAALLTLPVGTAALLAGGLALGKLAMPTGPQLGAATFLGIIVTVDVLASLVLDHFGWIGFQVHPPSVWRVAGVALAVMFHNVYNQIAGVYDCSILMPQRHF